MPDRFRVVALDERGPERTSVELARWLDEQRRSGIPGLAFLVGEADGLPPAVVAAAHERLSLSRLTLPHQLVFVVLAEQLYRATAILNGEPYHRD